MEFRLVSAAPPRIRGRTFARYRSLSHVRTLNLTSLGVTSVVMNRAVKYNHICDTSTNWCSAECFALFRKPLSDIIKYLKKQFFIIPFWIFKMADQGFL
jgi:hypothetical protein